MLYLFYALLLRSAERTCFTFKVNARLESLNGDYVKMSPIFFYNPDGMPIQVHTASVCVCVFFFEPVFLFFGRYPQVAARLACVNGSELRICFPDTHTHTKDVHRHVLLRGAET